MQQRKSAVLGIRIFRPILRLVSVSIIVGVSSLGALAGVAFASPPARTVHAAQTTFEASKRGRVERRSLTIAKSRHGLPPGISVPTWARASDNHINFTPSPRAWRQSDNGILARSAAEEEPDAGNGKAAIRSGEVPPIRFLGGAVQHHPTLHIVFWGSNWSGSSEKNELLNFYNGLSGSAYQGILTQYFDESGYISSEVSVDSTVDERASAPSNVDYAMLKSEVEYAESVWGHNLETQYEILPAPGTSYESSFTSHYCAFHDVASSGAVYSFVPYAGDEPFANGNQCTWYGDGSASKATTVMASHEYAESATDPLWDTAPGWRNRAAATGEIGDICATPGDELPNGSIAQGQYDDHQASCSIADQDPPHVLGLTEPATNVTSSTATMNGTVNPEGSSTTYTFEYGQNGYVNALPADAYVGSKQENVQVSQALYNLDLEQPYQYRLAAFNASGATYGEKHTIIPSTWQISAPLWESSWSQSWLNDLSCASAGSCMAVGYYYQPGLSPHSNRALAYQFTGGSWVQESVPQMEGVNWPELRGVSCPASNACVAVGDEWVSEGGYRPLVVRWDGSSWTTEPLTAPAGTQEVELTDVSCIGSQAQECMAVGFRKDASGVWINYSAEFVNGAWSNLSTPTAEGSTRSELKGVACVSLSSCVAVGWFTPGDGSASIRPFSMKMSSGSWQYQGRTWIGYLEGVTCTSGESCMAVGENFSALGPTTEQLNGSSWAEPVAVNTPDVGSGYFSGVSCVSDKDCMAVGSGWIEGSNAEVTLSAKFDGNEWSERTTPWESEVAPSELADVECFVAECLTVGASKASDNWQALVETRGDWTPQVAGNKVPSFEVKDESGRADVKGTVNPKGFDTKYHFEWGTEAGNYDHALPADEAGSGQTYVEVDQTIQGVKGNTTYHYRLVAENAEGQTVGEDRSFKTPDWRPKFWKTNVGRIGGHGASLETSIESSGFDTHYRFEWGTEAEYEAGEYAHSAPAPAEGDLGSSQGYIDRGHTLEGLRPHYHYHYRVVAENVEGTVTAEGGEFTTWASAFVPEGGPATVSTPADNQFVLEPELGADAYCSGAHMQGTVGSSSESLSMPMTETPTCNWFGGNVPFEMNGCSFEFEPGAPSEGGGFEGEFSIGPPGCGPITTEIPSGCPEVEIPPQIGLHASYENTGEGAESAVIVRPHNGTLSIYGAGGCNKPLDDSGYINAYFWRGWEFSAEDSEGKARGLGVKSRLDGVSEAATDVGTTTATLNATVYPIGSKVTYGFQYGADAEYGQNSATGTIEAGSEEPADVSETIEGLEPGTTYHFRLAALGGGFITGEDLTFTTSEPEPTRLEIEGHSGSVLVQRDSANDPIFTLGGDPGPICATAQLHSEASEATAALPVSAEYGGCEMFESFPTTVRMNSCHYLYGVDDTEAPFSGDLRIACDEEGDAIEAAVYFDAGRTEEVGTVRIAPQGPVGRIEYKNEGTGSARTVHAEFGVKGLTTSCEGEFCFLLGGGDGAEAGIEGGASLEAHDEAEEQVGLFVALHDPVGVYISDDEAAQAEIDAESFPLHFPIQRDSANDPIFTLGGDPGPICATAQLHSEASEATAALPVSAEYGGCEMFESFPTTVRMNSCHYLYGVDDTEAPFSGDLRIACDEEGDAIEAAVYFDAGRTEEVGTVRIAPQGPVGRIEYKNEGTGSARTVHAEFGVKGLTTSCEGEFCFLLGGGDGAEAGIEGGMTLEGYK